MTEKHGTCTGLSLVSYFQKAAQLYDRIHAFEWLRSGDIVPSNRTLYTPRQLQLAFESFRSVCVILILFLLLLLWYVLTRIFLLVREFLFYRDVHLVDPVEHRITVYIQKENTIFVWGMCSGFSFRERYFPFRTLMVCLHNILKWMNGRVRFREKEVIKKKKSFGIALVKT